MINRLRVVASSIVAAGVLCACLAHPSASGPLFWTVATQSDFLKGTPTGVSIDAAGRLLVAPVTNVVTDLSAPQAWSLLRADDGTWYAGTGGDGRVVRGRGQQFETVLDVQPSGIHALALSNGRLFAASSPEGAVHVIEADGTSRVFFDPAETYIWALAFDRQGRLWVGAGNPAVVYRVNPDGSSQVVYRPPARHVVSLAMDSAGRIFAGTDTPARLYRFADGDRPFAVLEPGFTELRSIRPAPDGSLFVSALTTGGEPSSDTSVTGSVTITVGGTTTGTSSTTSPATPPTRKSVVYRVLPDGTWDAVWETTDAVYDLAIRGDGNLLVATGPEGRLYQVSTTPATWGAVSLVNTADAKQITRLAMDGTRTLAITSNPGRVIAIGSAGGTAPSYVSSVRDAKTQAQWGAIRWEGMGAVALHTRSGNTETPDDSWSPWAAPTPQASGQAITSPAARFLQWRATLTPGAVAPVVTSVTVAYLARNLRPVVSEITVHPPGVVFQRPFSSDDSAIAGLDDAVADARRPPGGDPAAGATTLGRRMFSRGLQTIGWKAEDPDTDRLQFSLHYRREGEDTWRLLRDQLADMLFVWDTTSVPDGRYLVRVTANDALSNTPDRVMTGDRESGAIDVDNTPPVIGITVTGTRVAIRVTDAHSGVNRVDYSLGGQNWQALRPVDGLADSREEQFELTLPSAGDAARLVIRASDVMQNVTSAVAR
jgi:sugar lactone lactonase YvrE